MYKFKNNYNKYLIPALVVVLGVIFIGNANAFQVSGSGNNLRIVQSNQAKSANFQINAKLKPTSRMVATIFSLSTPQPIVPIIPSTQTTPITTNTNNSDDGSSPYTGTADWSKLDRSQKATERRKLAKEQESKIHTSAPKEIIENLVTQIVKTPDAEKINAAKETNSEISRDLPVKTDANKNEENTPVIYNPKTDKFVAISESQVVLNPANFSLKFLDEDIIKENPAKNLCQNIYINNFHQANYWYPIAKSLFIITICLTMIIFCLAVLVYFMWRKSREKTPVIPFWKNLLKLFPIILLAISISAGTTYAGPITTPQSLIYEGDLLDNAGNPLTGNYSFRFSLWDNTDFEASDNIAGVLNVGAADYFGWQETQTQDLVDGKFSLRLGTVTPFFAGLFDRTVMYLQIEVKDASAPDTSYELIDLNVADPLIDRTVIDTIPFAFNADKLDFRDSGYGPGEIPYIDPLTGKLPASIIEAAAAGIVGGVDGNTFALDLDGDANATDNIVLKFGDTLNKTLAWNGVNEQFEFNDNVNIAGNLVVTGTINGQSFGPKNKIEVLSPRYPNSIISEDGTDNSGSMFEEVAAIAGKAKNTLRWHTRQTDIQDFDVVIRYTLPANFAGFQGTNPLSLEFMTEGISSDAKVDIVIEKEGSTTDELQGTGIGFNSNAWTTVDLNLNSATTWNPNDTMIIKMKMYSRNNLQSYVSDIVLKYIEN